MEDDIDRILRAQLPAQDRILWHVLQRGRLHLGYRKRLTHTPGLWIMRLWNGRRYQKHSIGVADDMAEADGARILTFQQAKKKARELALTGDLTVRHICEDYLAKQRAEGRATSDSHFSAHILPVLGDLPVKALTAEVLIRWRDDLANKPARLRTPKGEAQRFCFPAVTPEEKQARYGTVNRVIVTLKAALNYALKTKKLRDDTAWRALKHFARLKGTEDYIENLSDYNIDDCGPVVYVVLLKSANKIKVGYSGNVRGRLRRHQSGVPDPLTILYLEPGTFALESKVKRALRAHLVRDEWFHFTDEVQAILRELFAKNVTGP